MYSICLVVKEFRGRFKRKALVFYVLLFHLEVKYLPVLKSLVHMYEMWQMNNLWLIHSFICIAATFLI